MPRHFVGVKSRNFVERKFRPKEFCGFCFPEVQVSYWRNAVYVAVVNKFGIGAFSLKLLILNLYEGIPNLFV